VLLIDDGSTDNSSAIARLYAERLDNFTYYRIENAGLGHARNYGASLASGKYIFFIDSDDMLTEGILKKMFETNSDVSHQSPKDVVKCSTKK